MSERKFTDLELERSLAGDLSPARQRALEAEATAADKARLDELRAEHAAFLGSVDVDNEVRRIEQRVERETPARPAWLRWLAPIGALAAAAAALLIIMKVRGGKPDNVPVIDDDLTTKGSDITLVIHMAGAPQPLASGDSVSPGARLRFEVPGTRKGFVAIVGVDGTGATSVYYPFGGTNAAPLGLDRLLPGAIQLDATPGDEHFYALFSEHAFAIPAVISPLPPGVVSSEVVLHKK